MAGFAGMDRGSFPGIATMQNLLNTTNLVWSGYYLTPAPSQRNKLGWMGNRAALVNMGWGLAPLYVGQQDPAAGQGNSNTLTAAQGTTDAQDAVNMMTDEGFPAGSVVYLDIELGGQLSQANLQQCAEILSQVTEPIAASMNAPKLPWAQSFRTPL